jgi:crossover junction endodeoxyribonuclease RusA
MTELLRTTFDLLDIDIHAPVVPYTRMTQRGKFVKPDALRYLASQKELKFLMSVANHNKEYYLDYYVPEKCQFSLVVAFYVNSMHHCDLDNMIKAVLDAGQGILYKDDRYCDAITATREKVEHEPHVRLIISPLEGSK